MRNENDRMIEAILRKGHEKGWSLQRIADEVNLSKEIHRKINPIDIPDRWADMGLISQEEAETNAERKKLLEKRRKEYEERRHHSGYHDSTPEDN